MSYIVQLNDPGALRLEVSGGKGARLAALIQSGFNVPVGFINSAEAYRVAVGSPPESLWPRAPETPAESGNEFDQARRISRPMRRRLKAIKLPEPVRAELRQVLAAYGPDEPFAVRSSSTMEDLAEAAFAGQHETFLNCCGLDAIEEAIRACYRSLWSERAVAYRLKHGGETAPVAMAVVVQRLVACDIAGVGFSLNPITGDTSEIVLAANYGLGESVVNGEEDVDHYMVDKTTGRVREQRIASKRFKVVPAQGRTRRVALDPESASAACLSADHIAALSRIVVEVERRFGFPQDIEWGIRGDELYLLQARPVTSIPPRWTRDESAERFPNAITPLTWDFVEEGFHQSLEHSFQLMGFPAFAGKWFGMHGHYIYGNQNAVEVYGRRMPVAVTSLEELARLVPRLRSEFRWVQDLPVRWMRDLDFYLIRLGELMAEPLEGKSIEEVWAYVLRVKNHGAQYFLPNIAISITQGALYRFLDGLIRLAMPPEKAQGLFDDLLAFCETKTGTVNKELYELAARVRARPGLERLLQTTPSREILPDREGFPTSRLAEFQELESRLQQFLRDHGHREMDFDAYHPTWLEAPWAVLDQLRLMLQGGLAEDPHEKERNLKIRMHRAEFELFQRVPAGLHYFYSEVLRLARLYTSLDDLEHYQTTRLTLPLRRGVRELGARLAARGVLEEAMDLFFARESQITEAIHADQDADWNAFRTTVQRQKAVYLADRIREPEWCVGGAAASFSGAGSETADGVLAGLPGSPGSAEGPVFHVLGVEDFARFPRGAVLVARTTSPTWTPLFYAASAVVTESGGPLSHGAVTAREMRIPAVMGVRGCLARLRNGDRVRVDGSQGKVTKI